VLPSQRQLSPIGDVEFSKYMMEIFFHCAFGEAQLVRNFLISSGSANQIGDLPLAERKLVPRRHARRGSGLTARMAKVLSPVGSEAVSATSTAPR